MALELTSDAMLPGEYIPAMWKELLLLVVAVGFFALSALAVYMGVGSRLRLVATTFLLIGSLVIAFAPPGLNGWLAVAVTSLSIALGCALVLMGRSLKRKSRA
jgi:hypothetical protein